MFNWSKRSLGATQRAQRNDPGTVQTVQMNEGSLYKQLQSTAWAKPCLRQWVAEYGVGAQCPGMLDKARYLLYSFVNSVASSTPRGPETERWALTCASQYVPGIWCQDLHIHLLQTECAWYLVSGPSNTPPSASIALVSGVRTFTYTSFRQNVPGIWCQDLHIHLLQTECAWYLMSVHSNTPPSASISLVSGVRTFTYTSFRQNVPGIRCQDLHIHLLQSVCPWYLVSGPSIIPFSAFLLSSKSFSPGHLGILTRPIQEIYSLTRGYGLVLKFEVQCQKGITSWLCMSYLQIL